MEVSHTKGEIIMSLLKIFSEIPFFFHYLRKIPEFGYNQTKQRIKKLTKRRNLPILDIGCGTGEFCGLFSSLCYVGIDVSDSYIKFAKKHYPEYTFKCQDGRSLEFLDKSFYYVLINGVIHHMNDIDAQAILLEASRVLRTSGMLILIESVPASATNILGNLMRSMDRGRYFRNEEENYSLVSRVFAIFEREKYRSGVFNYVLLGLKHRT